MKSTKLTLLRNIELGNQEVCNAMHYQYNASADYKRQLIIDRITITDYLKFLPVLLQGDHYRHMYENEP
jgi:hypothetical protein